ncbi:hypothetical protein [Streptomyces platensis]|uniref:hypothetical protein n=1 Tax=Streptomyces platensis TaxID=58346 RepID=UPI003791F3B9
MSFEAFNGREASLPASKFYSATQYKKTSGGTVTVVFGMTTESILVKSPAKTVKKGQKVGIPGAAEVSPTRGTVVPLAS